MMSWEAGRVPAWNANLKNISENFIYKIDPGNMKRKSGNYKTSLRFGRVQVYNRYSDKPCGLGRATRNMIV